MVALLRKMGKVYAVFKGRKPGIYSSWTECQSQVSGFKGCIYKSFKTRPEAESFMKFGNLSKRDEAIPDEATLMEIFADTLDNAGQRTELSNTNRKRKCDAIEGSHKPKAAKLGDSKLTINGIRFSVDEKNHPVVFTDGACSNNGKKSKLLRAGFGVWWGDNHPLNLSCRLEGEQTNQRAEIAAVNACLQQAKENGLSNITIRTDSMFVINCITKWVNGWRKKNWLKSDGKPVVHKSEFLTMLDYLKSVKVNWEHVRGHNGVYGNEMADKLAVCGAQS